MALAAAGPLARTDPTNPKVLDELQRDYDLLASIKGGIGQRSAAMQHNDLAESEASHHAANAIAQMTSVVIAIFDGDAQGAAKRPAEGLQLFRKAEHIFEGRSMLDRQDIESRGSGSRVKIADNLANSRGRVEAVAAYQDALTIAQPLISQSGGSQQALYSAADALAGLGDLSIQQAMRASAALRLKYWKDAQAWYSQSSSMWKRIQNPGAFSPSGFSTRGPPPVARAIVQCETILSTSD